MKRRALLAAPLALPGWPASGKGKSMNPDKVARLKTRIGFDAAVSNESRAEAAVVRWPDMRAAVGLAPGEWTLAGDSIAREGGGVTREWVLRRGRETVSILAFVASDGPEPARAFLLRRATENMLVDSPFVRGPADLGTLSVTDLPPSPPIYLWLFRNLCLEVEGRETAVDVLAIAHWLQALAAASLLPWAALARLPAPQPQLKTASGVVGRALELEVVLPADAVSPRYVLQVETTAGQAAVTAQRVQGSLVRLQLQGQRGGRTRLLLHLVDTHTLVGSRSSLDLDFTPAP